MQLQARKSNPARRDLHLPQHLRVSLVGCAGLAGVFLIRRRCMHAGRDVPLVIDATRPIWALSLITQPSKDRFDRPSAIPLYKTKTYHQQLSAPRQISNHPTDPITATHEIAHQITIITPDTRSLLPQEKLHPCPPSTAYLTTRPHSSRKTFTATTPPLPLAHPNLPLSPPAQLSHVAGAWRGYSRG